MTGPLDRRSLTLSLGIHSVVLVGLVWVIPALGREAIVYQAIEIRVVSAPPAPAPPPEEVVVSAPEEELVVETPDDPMPEEEAPLPVPEEAPPPEPEEANEPEPEEAPPPEPEEEPEQAETPPPEAPDPPPDDQEPAPEEAEPSEEEDAGEDINVRMEGLRRDYPVYYDNIIRQIERCFRVPDSRRQEAVVQFNILKDGSVADISMAVRSSSFVFNIRAQEAIECAGRPGRLGPLPQGYAWDVLPVQFRFRPNSSS